MPLVIGFVELAGAALLLTAAITGATFRQVIQGQAGAIYKANQADSAQQLAAAGASAPAAAGTVPTSAAKVGAAAASMVKYLVANGFTPVAAAGVVGNLQQESNLSPSAVGDQGTSGGLAQWHLGRWTALQSFAAALGLSSTSESAQLQFLVHEMKTGYAGTLAAINQATTPAEAALIVSNQYEMPNLSEANNPARQAYAQAAYTAAGY